MTESNNDITTTETPKRARIADKTVDYAAGTIEFAFKNGETRVVRLDEFSDDIRRNLLVYGLSQKFGDAYAAADGDATTAVSLFDGMYEALSNGEWSDRASPVPGGRAASDLIEAINIHRKTTGKDPLSEEQETSVRSLVALAKQPLKGNAEKDIPEPSEDEKKAISDARKQVNAFKKVREVQIALLEIEKRRLESRVTTTPADSSGIV